MAAGAAKLRLGLAGAEERLFSLQLDSGQISNVRNILKLRIDYLSQLNTPAMLVASADVSLLSTLSYSFLEPEDVEMQTFPRMLCVVVYTVGCSLSLGASLWVLYTCNNLVNLATMSTLAAKDLKGVQGADLVIELRMADVRSWYMLSLSSMVFGLFAMIFAMMEWYVAVPSIVVAILCTLHAIHADHETSYYFEKVSGVTLDARREYALDDIITTAYYAIISLAKKCGWRRENAFHALGCRIEEVFQRRYDRSRIRRIQLETARMKKQRSFEMRLEATGDYLLKTTSQKGPIAVLNTVAFERDPEVRRQLLQYTAANTPSHLCWWVLQGPVFMCYKTEEEWKANSNPSLIVDLHLYTVVETFDHARQQIIALLPKCVLRDDTPLDSAHHIDPEVAGKSWYLCSPEADKTRVWLSLLSAMCESADDLANALEDDSMPRSPPQVASGSGSNKILL